MVIETVSNAKGKDVETKINYITVKSTMQAPVLLSGKYNLRRGTTGSSIYLTKAPAIQYRRTGALGTAHIKSQ